jgi:hypothetical protein
VAGDFDYLYREIADATSGRFFDIRPGLEFADTLRDELVAFRQRYLLRYQPTGVGGEGWHELSVGVRGYDVRARRGYFRTQGAG